MKVYNVVQLSPEWWDLRRGIPTASRFDQICTPAKGEYSKSSRRLIAECIGELAALNPKYMTENPVYSRDMAHGRDTEPEARNWIGMGLPDGFTLDKVGFVTNDEGTFGASPDGVVRNPEGVIVRGEEIKCPNPTTHAEYLMDGQVIPQDYRPQVYGSLVVTGLPEWGFTSYCPGLEPVRVIATPADPYFAKMKAAMDQFLKDFREQKAKLVSTPEDKTGEALEQWAIRLDGCQSPEQLTASLPLLADLREWPEARRKAWRMICQYADAKGWTYNEAHKCFLIPQPVAAGAAGSPDW
jgi:hypothetical protein